MICFVDFVIILSSSLFVFVFCGLNDLARLRCIDSLPGVSFFFQSSITFVLTFSWVSVRVVLYNLQRPESQESTLLLPPYSSAFWPGCIVFVEGVNNFVILQSFECLYNHLGPGQIENQSRCR